MDEPRFAASDDAFADAAACGFANAAMSIREAASDAPVHAENKYPRHNMTTPPAILANPPPRLLAQIREDWIAHGRDWTRPGFRAVAAHRFGNWRMTVRPKLLRAPCTILYHWMYRKCRNHYGIELPYTVKLGRRVVIEHQGAIVIHGHCEIGDDTILRQGVTLGNKTLDRPYDAPRLGRRVNVGAGAKILGAVTIGDDAAIGANAVVVKDVPAGTIAVGIPAMIVPGKLPERPAPAEVSS